MNRPEIISQVVTAARKSLPVIRGIYEHETTAGRWYGVLAAPFHANFTGRKRITHFAFVGSNGSTFGMGAKTKQELIQRHTDNQDKSAAEFKAELDKMDDARIIQQARYWLTPNVAS